MIDERERIKHLIPPILTEPIFTIDSTMLGCALRRVHSILPSTVTPLEKPQCVY